MDVGKSCGFFYAFGYSGTLDGAYLTFNGKSDKKYAVK